MSLEKDWEDLTIPLFAHGDGVDFSNNDNLMVYSWGCLLSSTSTLLIHWLLACFPKSCGSKTSWEVIWKYLKWSFDALAGGRRPAMDPDNKPLEKGSVFHKLAGQPLHLKRYKAVLWSVIGDDEFFFASLVIRTAIGLAGSVMPRTSLHVPLEKGTRKCVWKSKSLKSSPMKNAWQTSQAKIFVEIHYTSCSAKGFMDMF